jgi:environmental stress-induced protein Ves
MRLLSPADYLRMPWKNGGGSTTQLAIAPAGAGLDDFDWRISSARVETAGPFSAFPGIDRSLAVLNGGALLLRPQDGQLIRLEVDGAPFSFPGEQAIDAALPAGPVIDFNVMTRRASWRHSLQLLHLSGTRRYARQADLMFIYCAQGCLRLQCSGGDADCEADHAILFDGGDGDEVTLCSTSPARLCVVRLARKGNVDAA